MSILHNIDPSKTPILRLSINLIKGSDELPYKYIKKYPNIRPDDMPKFWYQFKCANCGARGPLELTEDEARIAWERRPLEEAASSVLGKSAILTHQMLMNLLADLTSDSETPDCYCDMYSKDSEERCGFCCIRDALGMPDKSIRKFEN